MIIKKEKLFFVFIIILAWSNVSYHVLPKKIKNQYKASEDFKWLTDLKMVSETLSLEHFEKTAGRAFDSSGIYTDKGKYHPVNVFQFGIFCFDAFRKTNKPEYKKKCLDQFKYLLDSTNYTVKEDGSIGFPYHINFRDLKPLWYSGLAQSEGIMYLIRYYYLTKDSRALDYIQRIKEFMLAPQDSGGTLKYLSDDTVWIEEYPNSKSKPEVINGFVTAIMALREYTSLFPDDTGMKSLLKKCLYSHKKEFYKYDTGNGILYDLGERQVVGPWYNKWQVIQMKQMYELFKDTFYRNIEMLWASYAYNKTVPGMTGCLLVDTNFSSPGRIYNDWVIPGTQFKKLVSPENVKSLALCERVADKLARNLFDLAENTSYSFKTNDSITEVPFLITTLANGITANMILISSYTDSMDYSGLKFYTKDNDNWSELKINTVSGTAKNYSFSFKEKIIKQFKIEFRSLKGPLALTEVNLCNTADSRITNFTHYITPNFELSADRQFKVEKKNVDDFVIFYKTGNSKPELDKNKWNVYEGIRTENFDVKSKDKLCRLLLIFKNNSAASQMRVF